MTCSSESLFQSHETGILTARGHNHLSKNCYFSAIEYLVDLRPVFKLEFVRCGPIEETRVLYLSQFNCGSPIKFKNAIFQIGRLRFLTIFRQFLQQAVAELGQAQLELEGNFTLIFCRCLLIGLVNCV